MGLLDANCSSLFFQMQCDIYYAIESQDLYGGIDKKWEYDMVEPCSFYTISDKSNSNNFTYDDDRFYKLETMLYGRFQGDPRKSSTGQYFPLSHILVTNVRASGCNDESFFIETNGDYEVSPTVFELKTCQPFVGPFNTVEYYKIQLERSDIQGLNNRVEC